MTIEKLFKKSGKHVKVYSMQKRFFIKNLFAMLLCTVIPLLLLGITASVITHNNIQNIVNNNNQKMLLQAKSNIELIIDEMDSLNLSLSVNPSMLSILRRALRNEKYGNVLSDLNGINRNILIPTAAARPYVQSLYIYLSNDYRRFYTNPDGMETLDTYYDTAWYQSFLQHSESANSFWGETRTLQSHSFENIHTQIVSLYKKFFIDNGVVVLNIDKSYFDLQMDNICNFPEQSVIVLNDNNEILFKNKMESYLSAADINYICRLNQQVLPVHVINNKKYNITFVASDKYGWKYVSVIPHSSLYRLSNNINLFIILISILATIFCILLSILNVNRSYHNLLQIITLLEAAEKDRPIPALSRNIRDEYGYIMQNILKTFIKQNSLKEQLRREKYEAKMLEMSSLQSQISPHFLLNTLKSIFWMSRLTHPQNEVSTMIENLTNILDYALNNQESLVSFSDEIENLKSYVAIQQMRYKNKFFVTWVLPDNIGAYYTIKLLLQPLIENAIIHGMRWEEDRTETIRLKIIEKPDRIIVSITDNGVGIPREKLSRIREHLSSEAEEDHIGMYNCNRRLSLFFGAPYGLTIRSKQGIGTNVRAVLPKITQ